MQLSETYKKIVRANREAELWNRRAILNRKKR